MKQPPAFLLLVGLVLSLQPASAAAALPAPRPELPPALRNVDSRKLSGGVFSALTDLGVFPPGAAAAARLSPAAATANTGFSQPTRLSVLDPRAGHNQSIGAPPSYLGAQNQAAEPHLIRRGGLTLGAVQDGRYSDGGAAVCDYVFSIDGGYHWTRGALPRLTTANGGSYYRATDPVAAIDSDGTCYVNTIGATDPSFNTGALLVSHSTVTGGSAEAPTITWSDPVVAYQPSSSLTFTDKDWIAVNNYAQSATAHRVVVTYTAFTTNSGGASTGNNAELVYSDDHGRTWSAPVQITPSGSSTQGTQPAYLPDGSLFCSYFVFTSASDVNVGRIECKRSTDGGRTWPSAGTVIINNLTCFSDSVLRSGSFLHSATVARDSGDIWVTIAAVWQGVPRIIVSHSSDYGATWSTPSVASDTPSGLAVCLPTVAASPDGSKVAVTFFDKRDGADADNYVDLYGALSFDKGQTWQANVRLTQKSSDVRLGANTSEGYMLGDYLGLAAPDETQPTFTALWCGTAEGRGKPTTGQFSPDGAGVFSSWLAANFNATQRSSAGFASSTPFGGTRPLWQQYLFGLDPFVRYDGDVLEGAITNGDVVVSHPLRNAHDINWSYDMSADGSNWSTQSYTDQPPPGPTITSVRGNPGLETVVKDLGSYPSFHYYRLNASVTGVDPGTTPEEVFVRNSSSRISALSARGHVGTGQDNLVVGFYTTGGTKNMLVRGVGPTLAEFGVSDPLPDPIVKLDPVSGQVAPPSNDNWDSTPELLATFDRLGNFPLKSPLESVVLAPFASGGYTGSLADTQGRSGTGIAEFYDADTTAGSARLLSVSSRGAVDGTAGQTLVAGFVISGTMPRRVLIRAVGPGLSAFNIAQPLSTPHLELHRVEGSVATLIASNDSWTSTANPVLVQDSMSSSQAFSLTPGSADCALVQTLQPGLYTATASGASGAAGVVLVEVYDLP